MTWWLALIVVLVLAMGTFLNLKAFWGLLSLPVLREVEPVLDSWPKVSLIITACDEAATIEEAATSLLKVDYPNLELILIDDRSTDSTGDIIDDLARRDERVQAVHVTHLPDGWLGKVHALHQGTSQATGDFLAFADADVHFAPEMLKRVVTLCEREELGHITVMPCLIGNTFAVNAAIAAFAAGFLSFLNTHAINEPDSKAFAGVGAFGMVRRDDFLRTEGWEWLRMEIMDDSGLAMMMVQEAGARSMLVTGGDQLKVVWYPNTMGMIKGLEKNGFAGIAGYKLSVALGFGLSQMLIPAFLVLALVLPYTWSQIVGVLSLLSFVPLSWGYQTRLAHPFLASLCAPLANPIIGFAIIRSAVLTLWRGGITWRGTFYPLERLKKEHRVKII